MSGRGVDIGVDPVVEAYKKDVDVTLLDSMLRRTPEERIRSLQAFVKFVVGARQAMRRTRDPGP
jgi:hypothetical protein